MVGWQREGGKDYNVLHEHGILLAFAKPSMLYSHLVRPYRGTSPIRKRPPQRTPLGP